DFSYRIPAAPGRYTVTLTFVEPILGKGERAFDVLANDKTALADLDVAALAAGEHATVVRSFPVDVAANGLVLSFKGKTGKAMVSAIDVAPRP
ncbi:MAG TPA: malectin domain-containing carbohydrate-binding protein, partial [Caulobacter sp.]|nr:malectin domain-containing carbohydrate-binding protein [Caulobacter sp.]